jgi:hypothetical protein
MGCVFLTPFGPDRDGAVRTGTGHLATVAVHARAELNTLTGDRCPELNRARRAPVPLKDLSRTAGVSPKELRHAAQRVKPARAIVARSRTAATFCNDNSTADASRIKPVASVSGPNGFDVEGRSESTVPAALDRREKRAPYICERQRGLRSGCGLSGAGEQGARVAHRRHHTSWASRVRRLVAEKKTVVEAPTPGRQGPPVALIPATHVSEIRDRRFADLGSIPSGSTTELQHANGRRVPCSENTAPNPVRFIASDGRVVELGAVYFEMLTCEHCGASFPACGQCPFCRRPS